MARCVISSRETVEMRFTEQTGRRGRWQSVKLRRSAQVAAIAILTAAAGLAIGKLPLSASPTVKYRVAAVDRGSVVSVISAAGTVKPLAAILVGSQASGQIKELAADFNSRVTRGSVIARLNDDAVEARLAQATIDVEVAAAVAGVQRAQLERAWADADAARAAVEVARANLDRAETNLADAKRERDRKYELHARGVSPITDRERAELAYDNALTQVAAAKGQESAAVAAAVGGQAAIRVAAAQLENALAQVKQREAIVRQVRIDLEHTVIRAPIDGVVIERNVDIGQTVAASLQAPTLFTIAPDLRAMQVHANVDEADIGRVVAAQDVSFTVDAFPGKSFQGRVIDIRKMPQSTQNVVAYTVIISVENDDLLLMPGMTANARILVQKREEVLRIPNAALRFRPSGKTAISLSPRSGGAPAARILRAALDRLGLPPERRGEIDRLVRKSGCPVGDMDAAGAEETNAADSAVACREASRRLADLLSPEEYERYQHARSLAAREDGITVGQVWVLGPKGGPEPRSLKLGASDGLMTAGLEGDLQVGDRVIIGAEAEVAKSASFLKF